MADANPQEQIPLPHSVQQLIDKICTEQSQPPLEFGTRSLLSSFSEEDALKILHIIYNGKIYKSFDGFVLHLAKQLQNSPSKRLCVSPNSGLPSPHQNRSPAPTPTPVFAPVSPHVPPTTRLFMSPSTAPVSGDEGSPSRKGTVISAQMKALAELEFRKAFLILSYLGEERLERVLEPDQIQNMKDLPMIKFESVVWRTVGCKCRYLTEQDRIKYVDWDPRKTHIYHCYVSSDGSYKFKGPFLTKLRNCLQRALGDDNVLMVKFSDEVNGERSSCSNGRNNYDKYKKVLQEGIPVALRCYRFFVFKDGGKEEKKKDPTTSPVKCFFVHMDSEASIANQEYILCGKTVREARSIFMHADNLSSLSSYMARFSLILSKTEKADIDLSCVNVERIKDVPCRDMDGKIVYDENGKERIHSDGTGFISEDLALKCQKNVSKEDCFSAGNVEPLLIQCRLFNNGSAVKGTLLVNKKLPPRTIQVRPSMIKVDADPNWLCTSTINSLEIVGTSNKPKKAFLSKTLIALLSYGGVPDEYFMGILDDALQDAQKALSSKRSALRVAVNRGEMDDDFMAARMILSGIPLEESCLQYCLSHLAKEEKKALRGGKIHVPESYYLMGTVDPTGLLKSNEVCIILDNGHVSGDVLVYRNPGLYFGDIHVLKATYVKELKDFVGNSKFAIFFPCQGPRSLADEIATGDFDGDMYFVSRNPQLLEKFKPSDPWIETPSAYNVPSKPPSKFSDEELEDELFKLFLRTRFEPSYTVGEAADSWQAMMDRLLILGETEETDEMKKHMSRLINIYYDALDAPKKGGIKVEVPRDLKVDFFPHYMEKGERNRSLSTSQVENKKKSFISTSILGKIYDEVKKFEESDQSPIEVRKLPCFDVQVPEACYRKWESHYKEYRIEMRAALQQDSKPIKNEAADDVKTKYKQILYEAAEFEVSERRRQDIFDEARALYRIVYDYAASKQDVAKCRFVWNVAGSALYALYISENTSERPIMCSPSMLKELFS